MDILGTVQNALSGGVVGAAGGALGSIFGFAKSWLDKRHELKVMEIDNQRAKDERQHELAVMDREAEIDLAKTSAEVSGRINEADLANLQAGLRLEESEQETLKSMAGMLGAFFGPVAAALLFFTEVVRRLMRPVITAALVAATFKIAVDLGVKLVDFDLATKQALYLKVVDQVLFLTGVAVCFWFISRPHAGRELPARVGGK